MTTMTMTIIKMTAGKGRSIERRGKQGLSSSLLTRSSSRKKKNNNNVGKMCWSWFITVLVIMSMTTKTTRMNNDNDKKKKKSNMAGMIFGFTFAAAAEDFETVSASSNIDNENIMDSEEDKVQKQQQPPPQQQESSAAKEEETNNNNMLTNERNEIYCKEIPISIINSDVVEEMTNEIVCNIRFLHNSNKQQQQQQQQDSSSTAVVKLNSCSSSDHQRQRSSISNNNINNEYCITAMVTLEPKKKTPADSNTIKEEELYKTTADTDDEASSSSSSSSENNNGGDHRTSKEAAAEEEEDHHRQQQQQQQQQREENNKAAAEKEEIIINVGAATYRPPYSQYGYDVAQQLMKYPNNDKDAGGGGGIIIDSIDSNDDMISIPMANWLFELGMLHFPKIDMSQHDDPQQNFNIDWYSYQSELSINALRVAIQILVGRDHDHDHNDDNDNDVYDDDDYLSALINLNVERKSFIASVYYTKGEVYFTDPQLLHIKEAGREYKFAYLLYKNMLEDDPLQKQQIYDIIGTERRYGDACIKYGITLIQNMDTATMMMSDVDRILMSNGGADDGGGGYGYGYGYGYGEDHRGEFVSDTNYDRSSNAGNKNNPYSTVDTAQSMYQKAISIFERLVHLEIDQYKTPNDHWFVLDLRMGLSQALHHSATTYVLMSGTAASASASTTASSTTATSTTTTTSLLTKSLEHFQYAIRLYTELILPYLHEDSVEFTNCKTSLADIYTGLADAALQAGNYELAKESYAKSMQWYDQHNIPIAPYPTIGEENELVLQESLKLLQEYQSMVNGGTGGGGGGNNKLYPKGNAESSYYEYYYERNDGYEGDLLANIGSLYMAMGDNDLAISYLEQAIQLYQGSDDGDGHPMANGKFNLATALFHARRFHDSQLVHSEALDIWKKLYGDGVNPFVQVLDQYEEMLEQQLQQQQGGGFNMFQQQQQQQHQKPQHASSSSSFADDGNEGQSTTETAAGNEKEGEGTLQQQTVINLDQFRSSLKNATEAASASVKEEL